MSVFESQKALEEALRELYQDVLSNEYKPYDAPNASSSTDDLAGIGIVIHHSIVSIMNKVKEISYFRSRSMMTDDKQPVASLVVTNDELPMLQDVLRDAVVKLFREIASASKLVENPNPFDIGQPINEYTDQVFFEKDQLWRVTEFTGTMLFRCISDTEEPPSTLSLDWLHIEDGDPDRIYYIMLMNADWEKSYSDLLDRSILNAIVSHLLMAWYELNGVESERKKWEEKLADYVADARGATYRRKERIKTYFTPI